MHNPLSLSLSLSSTLLGKKSPSIQSLIQTQINNTQIAQCTLLHIQPLFTKNPFPNNKPPKEEKPHIHTKTATKSPTSSPSQNHHHHEFLSFVAFSLSLSLSITDLSKSRSRSNQQLQHHHCIAASHPILPSPQARAAAAARTSSY
jgi:hypothetical protein